MTTAIKIEHLQANNSLVELNTADLGQVMGGDDALVAQLTNVFLNPNTQLSYEVIDGKGVFRAVQLAPGVVATQEVGPDGVVQIVYRPG